MLKFNEIKNFFIILFAYCIQNYAKLKINRVIIPVSLENSQETANLNLQVISLKFPVMKFTIVDNTGLTKMELG